MEFFSSERNVIQIYQLNPSNAEIFSIPIDSVFTGFILIDIVKMRKRNLFITKSCFKRKNFMIPTEEIPYNYKNIIRNLFKMELFWF